MTQYELYVFFLCLIVFILLTTASVACVWIIAKLSVRLTRCGAEDESILAEYRKAKDKKVNKVGKVLEKVLSVALCLVLLAAFVGSLYINCTENSYAPGIPTYRVVKTGSMATVHPDNTYVQENGLTDQIQTFDLIRTYQLPAEEDLELYDIVVYQLDDISVVHRIVEIEEPNESHPDCRYFLLQGDAVESPDRFPVLYSQMQGIYRGERTPFIGSFILFMQSPAGWLCIALMLIAMFAAPLLDKKIDRERKLRLKEIGGEEDA